MDQLHSGFEQRQAQEIPGIIGGLEEYIDADTAKPRPVWTMRPLLAFECTLELVIPVLTWRGWRPSKVPSLMK